MMLLAPTAVRLVVRAVMLSWMRFVVVSAVETLLMRS